MSGRYGTFRRIALPCAVVILGATDHSRADTITVPGDAFDVQSALDAALPGDEIVVASGTWLGPIDLLDKAVTLRSANGAGATILDGQDNGTVVTGAPTGAVIDGFTITGGSASQGGGMRIVDASPMVMNCVFLANDATLGGGAYTSIAAPTFLNCTFDSNTAGFGGGVYNRDLSTPRLIGCLLVGNVADIGSGGGMLNVSASPEVIGCTFSGNLATQRSGGGMFNSGGQPEISKSSFLGNVAEDNGGGIQNDASSPIIVSCRFEGNVADFGGGLSNQQGSSPIVVNCALIANQANRFGGGVNNVSAGLTITNCTLWGNAAADGGGGVRNVTSIMTVKNCIIWSNAPDAIDDTLSTTLVDHSCLPDAWPGRGNVTADPLLVDPLAGELALLSNSPCLDTGDSFGLPPDELDVDNDGNRWEPVPFDLTGAVRTGCPEVDMGAVEAPSLPCPGNLTGGCSVGFSDLLQILLSWGPCPAAPEPCPEDFDDDGVVGPADLALIFENWGTCPTLTSF